MREGRVHEIIVGADAHHRRIGIIARQDRVAIIVATGRDAFLGLSLVDEVAERGDTSGLRLQQSVHGCRMRESARRQEQQHRSFHRSFLASGETAPRLRRTRVGGTVDAETTRVSGTGP